MNGILGNRCLWLLRPSLVRLLALLLTLAPLAPQAGQTCHDMPRGAAGLHTAAPPCHAPDPAPDAVPCKHCHDAAGIHCGCPHQAIAPALLPAARDLPQAVASEAPAPIWRLPVVSAPPRGAPFRPPRFLPTA